MDKDCAARIREAFDGRIDDLRRLWAGYCEGQEEVEDLGSLFEYGLCFDYVAPGTFDGQLEGYWRYQLSWGGPSDEFRFYSSDGRTLYRIEYWFLDWFDGAKLIPAERDDCELLMELWDWFVELGAVESEYEKARES